MNSLHHAKRKVHLNSKILIATVISIVIILVSALVYTLIRPTSPTGSDMTAPGSDSSTISQPVDTSIETVTPDSKVNPEPTEVTDMELP
jgi:hypothetical protein